MRRELLARIAVSHFYALEGTLVGIWSSELPTLQDNLELDDAQLGLASLFSYLGSLIATFIAEWLILRFGSKMPTIFGAVVFISSLIAVAFSTDFVTLCLAMLYFGFTMGVMDVSMNASGITTETMYGKFIFGSFHASYSFSASAASFLGGALQSLSFKIIEIFAGVSATVLMTTIVVSNYLYTKDEELNVPCSSSISSRMEREKGDDNDNLLPSNDKISSSKIDVDETSKNINFWSLRISYYLCAVGFLAAFGECSLVTWCIVFINRYIDESPVVSSLGLSVFMIFMGTGRLLGDWLRAKFGIYRIVFYGGLLACAGTLTMFSSVWMKSDTNIVQLVVVNIGIAMTGCGLSTLIPTVFITGGRIPGVEISLAIARLSIFTNLGAVSGPPLIGFVSTLFNDLQFAYLFLSGIMLFITYCSVGFRDLSVDEVLESGVEGVPCLNEQNSVVKSQSKNETNTIIDTISHIHDDSLLKPLLI